MERFGGVPVPKALAAIEEQVKRLEAQGMDAMAPAIAKLKDFAAGLQNKTLPILEDNRAVLGEAFSDPSLASIKTVGEKAVNAIYGPLREDMGAFIKANGGDSAFAAWKSANDRLSAMAGQLKNSAMKNALDKGDLTPEATRTMLFSAKPSDVQRLYDSLTPAGQASARTAIVQELVAKAGGAIEEISPQKLVSALDKISAQTGVFFKAADRDAVLGLSKALKLTRRAAEAAVSPPTGVQAIPYALGAGLTSLFGSVGGGMAAGMSIGALARIYETTGIKRALVSLSKASKPQTQSMILQRIETMIRDAGIPAAGQSASGPKTRAIAK